MNPWITQDGPHWRSRAETLRKTAEETDFFRPETKARMLRMAKDYDIRAQRVEARARAGSPLADRVGGCLLRRSSRDFSITPHRGTVV